MLHKDSLSDIDPDSSFLLVRDGELFVNETRRHIAFFRDSRAPALVDENKRTAPEHAHKEAVLSIRCCTDSESGRT